MWWRHAALCVAIGVLAVPTYYWDRHLLSPISGNFIALDLRGLIFEGYLIFAGMHVSGSSLLLFRYPRCGCLVAHTLAAILASLTLIVIILSP